MPGRQYLEDELVRVIKGRLAEGATQAALAEEFLISQSLVSNICTGAAYAAVPWPDGSTGPLPPHVHMAIRTRRRGVPRGPRAPGPLPATVIPDVRPLTEDEWERRAAAELEELD